MEYPFFTDSWARFRPAYPYYTQANQRPSPPPKSKVISIPVFDAADSAAAAAAATTKRPAPDPSASAIKIQKAFRGFLVRNNMRTIRKISTEVEEIAAIIAAAAEDEEAPVRRDAKERLRLGEMLMALLLRLDSVRGVREYRKKVIRRVIQLQEAVDSIAATPPPDPAAVAPESMIEIEAATTSEAIEVEGSMMVNESEAVEAPESTIVNEKASTAGEGVEIEASDGMIEEGKVEDDIMDVLPVSKPIDLGVVHDAMEHSLENQIEEQQKPAAAENGVMMREMMERVVVESGRMKEMVAELCEQSAKQCQLMGALARRVEQLEDKVDRMEQRRRKKKKTLVNNTTIAKKQ